jgi:hypothetical protein
MEALKDFETLEDALAHAEGLKLDEKRTVIEDLIEGTEQSITDWRATSTSRDRPVHDGNSANQEQR